MSRAFAWAVVLAWSAISGDLLLGEELQDVIFFTRFDPHDRESKKEFSYNGRPIGEGREGFKAVVERISKLPAGTSIVWGPNYARCGACSGSEPECVAKEFYPDLWKELERHVAERRLTLSSSYPGPWIRKVTGPTENNASIMRLDWQNYRGPGTPHNEILYFINGEYVGRGDEGFGRILDWARKLPITTEVEIPRYEHIGRAALENMSDEERIAKNNALRSVLPFSNQKAELSAIFVERKLKAKFAPTLPGGDAPSSVLSWASGDRGNHTFAKYGRIVRHNELPARPAALLSWSDYEPDSDAWDTKRLPEMTATFTLNDKPLGKGVDAFAKAMDQLGALPAGSVVQVRACIRTKGPFTCPLVYEGQRHFERTGFEPYFGLYPWLIDVARKHDLKVEWLPDEGESCEDCELNK